MTLSTQDQMKSDAAQAAVNLIKPKLIASAKPITKNMEKRGGGILDIELREGVAEYDRKSDLYIPVEQLKELDYDRWKKLMTGEIVEADFPEFAKAVISALEAIIDENPGKRVAVACHGGVINVWTSHVIGFEPKMFFNPNYTSINRFMAASSGEKSVVSLNEYHHLKR